MVAGGSQASVALPPTLCRWLAQLIGAVLQARACTTVALACALRERGLSTATLASGEVRIRRLLHHPQVTSALLLRAILTPWPAPGAGCAWPARHSQPACGA